MDFLHTDLETLHEQLVNKEITAVSWHKQRWITLLPQTTRMKLSSR